MYEVFKPLSCLKDIKYNTDTVESLKIMLIGVVFKNKGNQYKNFILQLTFLYYSVF